MSAGTTAALLRDAARALADAGVDNPPFEAELLMAHAMGAERAGVLARLRERPGPEISSGFQLLIKKRLSREPLQYIIGRSEFAGLDMQLTPDVLIPRPETEILVEEGSSFLDGLKGVKGAAAADIGTGSGCIAVSLAASSAGLIVYAVDRSQAALDVARQNAAAHGVSGRIRFLKGDLFAPLKDAGLAGGLDLIVSNPPYIPSGEMAGLQPEVRFEPAAALDGGPDGLGVIRRIIEAAPGFLKPGGALMLEIGMGQADAVRALVADTPGLAFEKFIPDFAGIERVAVARKE